MPTIGTFHRQYWRQRANTPPPPGTGIRSPRSLTPVLSAQGVHSVVFGPPLDLIRAWWIRLRNIWVWGSRYADLPDDHRAVLERVVAVMALAQWDEARQAVQACATSPSFHDPSQWVDYSRAVKGNIGQAQNVFRHLRVVQELTTAHPGLTNPDAHLLAELAYQAHAQLGRPDRRIVNHPKRLKSHPVMVAQ